MSLRNPLNVYKGPNSMKEYYDPDIHPMLPLIELPSKLNPFRDDKVRIYAKMMTAHPTQNVKGLPAFNILLNDPENAKKQIIEPSSGSTVMSYGLISRVLYDNGDVRAYCTNKTEMNRLRQLQFWGIKVELYGGPAQPEVTDPRGPIGKSRQMAKENDHLWNPGQYVNENNWRSHVRWTGPQILKQLPEINVLAMGMGSAGCVAGTGTYLKSQKPSVAVIGVCNVVGDPIPGPRPFQLMPSSDFPWRQAVTAIESSPSVESYRMSMQLSREGLICGPSSGMNLNGLLHFLQRAKDDGDLHKYAEPDTGEISCVFICCDNPHQYLDAYFERLGEDEFHPIINKQLLHIDKDGYDLKWELNPAEAISIFPDNDFLNRHQKSLFCSCAESSCHFDNFHMSYDSTSMDSLPSTQESTSSTSPSSLSPDLNDNPASKSLFFLDLRSPEDFSNSHIRGSISIPLSGLTAEEGSPFDNVKTLEKQWMALKDMFSGDQAEASLRQLLSQNVSSQLCDRGSNEDLKDFALKAVSMVVLCYHGETSQMATAMMRARGLKAFSVKGGVPAMQKLQES